MMKNLEIPENFEQPGGDRTNAGRCAMGTAGWLLPVPVLVGTVLEVDVIRWQVRGRASWRDAPECHGSW